MNDLNLKKRDYLEAKGNAEHFNEVLQGKRSEIAEMENDLTDAKNVLQQLHSRLNTAHRDMATGRLSTDQFMELKREISEKEYEINIFSEAIAAQKSAIEVITDDYKSNKRGQNEYLKSTATDLSGQFADEVAALAGDPIKNMIHALVASKGKQRAFTALERQRDQEAIYLAIGEALCRRAFPNDTGALEFVPDLLQAKKHVNDLIEQLPSKTG